MKLVNYLQVRVIDVFFTIFFRVGLLPYLRLAITGMKRNNLIKHKEVVVVCEERGLVSLSYNALLTTPKANVVVKLVVLTIIVESTLTYTNCGKTGHSMETCHNRKKEVVVVSTIIELIVGTKPQLVKLGKIPIRYPCIICSSIEHRSKECPRKIEV